MSKLQLYILHSVTLSNPKVQHLNNYFPILYESIRLQIYPISQNVCVCEQISFLLKKLIRYTIIHQIIITSFIYSKNNNYTNRISIINISAVLYLNIMNNLLK